MDEKQEAAAHSPAARPQSMSALSTNRRLTRTTFNFSFSIPSSSAPERTRSLEEKRLLVRACKRSKP